MSSPVPPITQTAEKLFETDSISPGDYQKLIAFNPKVDIRNSAGRTPLSELCSNFYPSRSDATNLLAIAELLLRAGADPGASEPDGWTPLHYAVFNDNPALVTLLVEYNAPLLLNAKGESPFAKAGFGNDELVGALFDRAAATKFDIPAAEATRILERLAKRTDFGTVLAVAETAFVETAAAIPTITLVADHDKSIAAAQGYLRALFASMAAAVGKLTGAGDPSVAAMAQLFTKALADLERIALAEHGESVVGAATWIGHIVGVDVTITVDNQRIRPSGWSPSEALLHRSLSLADALTSNAFDKSEHSFLKSETEQVAFALSRALELYVVEKFFNPCRSTAVVGKLAKAYAALALTAVSAGPVPVRFPSGTRTHSTFLTIASADGGKTLEVVQHNFGILIDKFHPRGPGSFDWYPFAVQVNPDALEQVFATLVPLFSRLGQNLTSAAILPELYGVLTKSGKVIKEPGELAKRFLPFVQQVVDNCALYSLLSATSEIAVRTVPDPAITVEKLHVFEMESAKKYAVRVFGVHGSVPTLDEIIHCGELSRAILTSDDTLFAAMLTSATPNALALAGQNDQTVLHLAAKTNQVNYVRDLLKAGAVSLPDGIGRLPIELCTQVPVAQLLLGSLEVREVDDDRYFIPNKIEVYASPQLDGPVVHTLPERSRFSIVRVLAAGKVLAIACVTGSNVVFGYISSKKYVKVITT